MDRQWARLRLFVVVFLLTCAVELVLLVWLVVESLAHARQRAPL